MVMKGESRMTVQQAQGASCPYLSTSEVLEETSLKREEIDRVSNVFKLTERKNREASGGEVFIGTEKTKQTEKRKLSIPGKTKRSAIKKQSQYTS